MKTVKLHNIPLRTADGKAILDAFIPATPVLHGDYGSLEHRILLDMEYSVSDALLESLGVTREKL
jgi:DNA polymerase I-like protein with 3'-5' exonuclease and polymerase domains